MGGGGPGCLLIRAEGDVVRFINACAAEGVSVQRFCSTDGISFFYIPARQWRQAKMLAERCGAVLTIREQDGVSYILHPAASFFVGETRYTANSILITRMDIIQESGLSYYDAATRGRVFAVVK